MSSTSPRSALVCLCLASLLGLGASCAPPPSTPDKPAASKTGNGNKESAPRPPRSESADDDEEGAAVAERRDPGVGYTPTPRSTDLELSDTALQGLLAVARAGCDGQAIDSVAAPIGLPSTSAPVIGVLYAKAGKRIRSHRQDDAATLRDAAFQVGAALCKSADDREGFVHLLVVTKQAHLLNFGIKGLFDNKVFEPQVTGVVYHLDDKRFELDPLEQLERNMGPSDSRTALARGIGLDANQVTARIDLTMEFYRTAHVGERFPDKQATHFFRGHKRFSHQDLTHDVLQQRLKLIGEWYKNNVVDGEVTYMYVPSRQTFANQERTMIRSTISAMVLNRLGVFLDDKELQSKGKDVIDYYLEHYFKMAQSKQKGVLVPSTTPLANGNTVEARWTVAGFLAAAANERLDRESYREEMNLLMKWGATHQRKDGVIWTPSAGEQYFMPGQFLLPVSYFYRDAKDPVDKQMYQDIFDKAFKVYAPNLYHTMDFGPEWHTPYAPAWFTMPLAQMYLATGNNEYKDLIFAINDRALIAYDMNSRYQVYPDYDGMLAPKPGSMGNNSVTAASLEALADAAIVAKKAGDLERYRRYQKVIKRTTAFLLRLQYLPENTYYLQDRQRVVGAFKNDMVNTRVWMDSVWHLTSAFIKIQQHRLLED